MQESGAQLAYAGPLVIQEDTGVTYSSKEIESDKPHLRSCLVRNRPTTGRLLLIPLLAVPVAWMVSSLEQGDVALRAVGMIVLAILLLGWPIPMISIWLRNRRGDKLGDLLLEKVMTSAPLSDNETEELRNAVCDERVRESDRSYQCRRAYLELLRNIVEDGQVTDTELSLLTQLEEIFDLDPDFIAEARVDTYREVYLEAVGDHELTTEEEQTLNHIREKLEISEGDVSDELEVQTRLGEVRDIRSGELPMVSPSKTLSKGETCHYEGVARILKLRNLKSFQRDGQKYKVQGFVIDKEGRLLLTSKRIHLIHQGTSSIPLNKVLDLEVDYDQNLLTIVKDGAKTPVYVTTPDALKAGAIVAAASGL